MAKTASQQSTLSNYFNLSRLSSSQTDSLEPSSKIPRVHEHKEVEHDLSSLSENEDQESDSVSDNEIQEESGNGFQEESEDEFDKEESSELSEEHLGSEMYYDSLCNESC
uniref:Uncharacterized protein n=1 Tax=Amphimedon queenslandica TaxID=400682 RepID=A0A1X7UMI8_AMPQE